MLDARRPDAPDRAQLTLSLPYTVHPDAAIAFDENYPGSAGLRLKVEAGAAYLEAWRGYWDEVEADPSRPEDLRFAWLHEP